MPLVGRQDALVMGARLAWLQPGDVGLKVGAGRERLVQVPVRGSVVLCVRACASALLAATASMSSLASNWLVGISFPFC